MARLLVIGARQKRPGLTKRPEWEDAEEGVVLSLDTETGRSEVCFRHRTPAHLRPGEASSSLFKAGSWDDDGMLLLCTSTEVLKVDPHHWRADEHWTHPWMNDVHHVSRGAARSTSSARASTGCSSSTPASRPPSCAPHSTRTSGAASIRRATGAACRPRSPDRAHPNFVFHTRHGTWLTRLVQCDAICLDDPARRIDIRVGNPHDGHAVGDGCGSRPRTGA